MQNLDSLANIFIDKIKVYNQTSTHAHAHTHTHTYWYIHTHMLWILVTTLWVFARITVK